MSKSPTYSLYNNSNEIIFHGNNSECAEFLGISKSMFSQRACGVVGCDYAIVKEKEPYDSLKNDKDYDRVLKHLKVYGNTIVKKRSGIIFNRLKTEGYKIKMHRGTYGNYWVVELCNGNS